MASPGSKDRSRPAGDTIGITPIHRAWQPRRGLAGTFDDEWKNSRWPLYPADFNPDFFQQAPESLRLSSGHFRGDEKVRIRGLGRRPAWCEEIATILVEEAHG